MHMSFDSEFNNYIFTHTETDCLVSDMETTCLPEHYINKRSEKA